MVIVIPSKNIYSINFDPVIDNQIDKVEFEVKNVVLNNYYDEPVYDEKISSANHFDGAFQDNIDGYADYSRGGGLVAAYVAVTPYYTRKQFAIPKTTGNSRLKSIKLLPVYYSTVCKEINGTVTASLHHLNTSGTQASGFSIDQISTNYPTQSAIDKTIDLPKEYEKEFSHKIFDGILAPTIVRKAQLILDDKTNLNLINEDENNYYLEGLFCCGEEIIKIGHYEDFGVSRPVVIPVTGTSVLYSPVQIAVTIYGTTITLDLQDKTVSIGNGNKVFSFDGNELIQSTNTPTQESKYQEIIDKWKDGKQTATIACPIVDFYDTNGNKVIDTSVGDKMLFDIGDIVIPYTYTNQGDKPISYNKNFTPKRFKVVGVGISKQQGGAQELTLQAI